MYICNCNEITDKKIKELNPKDIDDLMEQLDKHFKCNHCKKELIELVKLNTRLNTMTEYSKGS